MANNKNSAFSLQVGVAKIPKFVVGFDRPNLNSLNRKCVLKYKSAALGLDSRNLARLARVDINMIFFIWKSY